MFKVNNENRRTESVNVFILSLLLFCAFLLIMVDMQPVEQHLKLSKAYRKDTPATSIGDFSFHCLLIVVPLVTVAILCIIKIWWDN